MWWCCRYEDHDLCSGKKCLHCWQCLEFSSKFFTLMKRYIITPNFYGCLEIKWSADARVFSRLPSPWPRKALGMRLRLPLTLCRGGRDSRPLDHTLGDISFLSILLRSHPIVTSISDPSSEVVNLLNRRNPASLHADWNWKKKFQLFLPVLLNADTCCNGLKAKGTLKHFNMLY